MLGVAKLWEEVLAEEGKRMVGKELLPSWNLA